MMENTEKNIEKDEAKAQLDCILDWYEEFENEETTKQRREEIEREMDENPLSVEFRSGWTTNTETMEPEEFCVLLCTGGPAVRIIGELDKHGQAYRPRLQYCGWGTGWTDYFLDSEQKEKITNYCNRFMCF